jgi:general secretion pathway protein L
MADTFVLRYPASDGVPDGSPEAAEWLLVDAHGARVGATGRGTLADAAQAQGSHRLLVLVPGTAVTLAAPELPVRSAGKLAKLVPFALEEQIATEIDAMHFAIGRQGANRRVPVAAVERARFAGWLAALDKAGLAPAAVYPDSLVVPDNPSHVVIVLEGGRVVVRRPGALPLALEADPLEAALAVAGLPTSAADGPDAAAHVLVYADAADWPRQQPVVEALHDRVASLKVQVLADGVLPLLAADAIAAPPFSLLQGEFQTRQGLASQWPRWRLAAGLAAAFLVLHVAALGVDWWRLSRDEAKVDQELRAAATAALPNVQNIARLPSLRAAVEGRVRSTRAAFSEGLLGTLGVLAASVAAAPGTQVQSLSYHAGTTDLTLDAPDVAALDRVQETAKGRGFDAQLQGAAQKEQRYEGHLQLKGPGR